MSATDTAPTVADVVARVAAIQEAAPYPGGNDARGAAIERARLAVAFYLDRLGHPEAGSELSSIIGAACADEVNAAYEDAHRVNATYDAAYEAGYKWGRMSVQMQTVIAESKKGK